MSLWRVEWLRLWRTRRWLALTGVFLFFGLLGPITAAYMDVILGRLGGDIQVIFPPPTPVAGLEQFMANALQVGLLVVLAIAAGALAFDNPPERAMFYRSRVTGAWSLLAPRYTVTALAACGAFILGTAGAWYETVILLGPLPAGAMVLGALLTCLYLAFAVAVVALSAAIFRGVLGVIALSAAVLLTFPLLGLVPELRPWLPGQLLGALTGLAGGAEPGSYLRAAVVTVLATAALLPAAAALLTRREV
jgi:ABC-2 type transport system permease protein